jgi:hypothetical protein
LHFQAAQLTTLSLYKPPLGQQQLMGHHSSESMAQEPLFMWHQTTVFSLHGTTLAARQTDCGAPTSVTAALETFSGHRHSL